MKDAPETRPASIVHPSWGVNVQPVNLVGLVDAPGDATVLRRGAHSVPDDVEEYEEEASKHVLGPTALVTVVAMLCATLCVAIVSLFGDARGGAVLAGVIVLVGAVMAWIFRGHWS